MAHSDDRGLVLPPNIAPIKAVIIPIWNSEETKKLVLGKAKELRVALAPLTVEVDETEGRPGEKHYKWEKKGVPVRIELGPRDVEAGTMVIVRRDTGEKFTVPLSEINKVEETLSNIQTSLYEIALSRQIERIKKVDTWEEFKQEIEKGNFVLAHWSGDVAVEKEIKEETKATIRCIPFDQIAEDGKCIKSGASSKGRVIFAKAY